jgi:hypothetical protein
VGVERCWAAIFSSRGNREAILDAEPWEPELPSRLFSARSWCFFDLKEKKDDMVD